MFGKSDEDKKKEEEKKKLESEQKKLEEEAVNGKPEEKKPEEGGGLGGLKNMGGEPADEKKDEKKDEKPPEDKPKDEPPAPAPKDDKPEDKPPGPPAEEPKPGPVPAPPEEPKPEEKPPEEPAPAEEPEHAEEPKPEKKASPSDIEKLEKQLVTQKESMRELEKEKAGAMKKSDELAGLVEDLSTEMKNGPAAPAPSIQPVQPAQAALPDFEPKLKEMEERTASQIKSLKGTIEEMTEKKAEGEKDEEEVAVTMKKMFDKRLKELGDKLDEAKAKPAPGAQGAKPGAAGEAATGLMAMGGGVELRKETDSLKRSLKDLATLVDAFKEEAENRFMALDRELEVLDRFPDMEQKMEQFQKKLGPENVQRLRMLISSADDLKEEVIPLVVKRETEEKIEPLAKSVKKVEEVNEKVKEKLAELLLDIKGDKKDIKTLYKFDERVSKLEDTAKAAGQLMTELKTAMKDLDKNQRRDMTEKMKEIFPGMLEAESSTMRKDFVGRFAFIEDKMQSIENMVSEVHKDIAELSALKGEMDTVEDKITALNEYDEKLGDRIDALKAKDHDILDKMEELQTPKEIITELDNKTKDILEIKEFFVRRTDSLEERINQLDKRAIPTKKLHDKVDSIFNNLADLRENQKKLEQKFDAEKNELQKIIAQHAEAKRKLEDKLKEQKTRIGFLLKEFK